MVRTVINMSFYNNTSRTKDGRKKRQKDVKSSDNDESFYKKTGRDHVGRKKKKN